QVRSQVRSQVGHLELRFYEFGWYVCVFDYSWVSYCDFFSQIDLLHNENFNRLNTLLQSGIYDTIQLEGVCFVSGLPSHISRNNRNQLHCEDGPAIQFRDGYSQYYWNGVYVPEFWIMDKDKITKSVIKSEKNAERRRVLREILGPTRYFELLGGIVEIDRDTDDQGNEMVL